MNARDKKLFRRARFQKVDSGCQTLAAAGQNDQRIRLFKRGLQRGIAQGFDIANKIQEAEQPCADKRHADRSPLR